jgi:hypothetical protein
MTITVQRREVYGPPLYYPVCSKALALTRLIRTKTLTEAMMRELKDIGVVFIII